MGLWAWVFRGRVKALLELNYNVFIFPGRVPDARRCRECETPTSGWNERVAGGCEALF